MTRRSDEMQVEPSEPPHSDQEGASRDYGQIFYCSAAIILSDNLRLARAVRFTRHCRI